MKQHLITLLAGATLLVPAPGAAQDLASRVNNAPAGTVHFTFESKPGVCGNGENISIRRLAEDGVTVHEGGRQYTLHSGDGSWNRDRECIEGPVQMEITRSNGRITGARARVGAPRPAGGTDLGAVDAAGAVAYLLSDATLRAAEGKAADRMIFAATLGEAESWPDLLRVARTQELPSSARKNAVFWVAQEAGDRAAAGLESIVGNDSDELEVRKQAVFALSQIRTDATVDALIEIARSNREPELRRTAMFWLGQSGSDRAIAFFEEILRG